MRFAFVVLIAVDGLSKSLVIIYHHYSIQTGVNGEQATSNKCDLQLTLFPQQVQICMHACVIFIYIFFNDV